MCSGRDLAKPKASNPAHLSRLHDRENKLQNLAKSIVNICKAQIEGSKSFVVFVPANDALWSTHAGKEFLADPGMSHVFTELCNSQGRKLVYRVVHNFDNDSILPILRRCKKACQSCKAYSISYGAASTENTGPPEKNLQTTAQLSQRQLQTHYQVILFLSPPCLFCLQ